MKIVVIGGTGLIGKKLIPQLRAQGHDAIAASPSSGVDTLTGAGLAQVLEGAAVVVDVSNSPSFEASAVLSFFETSTRNLLAAEAAAGVRHHVALSVVGTDRWPEGDYFRAKLAQETLIASGPIPYSIVRATQFFEFLSGIAAVGTRGNEVHVAPVRFQPIAADDVAEAVARAALAAPSNTASAAAGPHALPLGGPVRLSLRAGNDAREVVADQAAGYFGTPLPDNTLVPLGEAHLGAVHLADWLKRTA